MTHTKQTARKSTGDKAPCKQLAPKATDAVQFYKAAFGAVVTCRTIQPKRKAEQELPHFISAHPKLAGSSILVSDLSDDTASAKARGIGFVMCLETEDVEAAVTKAVAAGALAKGEIIGNEKERGVVLSAWARSRILWFCFAILLSYQKGHR